jgi:hypothetical protein
MCRRLKYEAKDPWDELYSTDADGKRPDAAYSCYIALMQDRPDFISRGGWKAFTGIFRMIILSVYRRQSSYVPKLKFGYQ